MWKRKPTKQPNPLIGIKSKTKHGNLSEKRVLENMGAEQTLGSGAFPGMKSDGVLDQFRIECKATCHNSIQLQHAWLLKIRAEALETNRLPLVTVSFTDNEGKPKQAGDWVMMPSYLLQEFLDHYGSE